MMITGCKVGEIICLVASVGQSVKKHSPQQAFKMVAQLAVNLCQFPYVLHCQSGRQIVKLFNSCICDSPARLPRLRNRLGPVHMTMSVRDIFIFIAFGESTSSQICPPSHPGARSRTSDSGGWFGGCINAATKDLVYVLGQRRFSPRYARRTDFICFTCIFRCKGKGKAGRKE